MYIHTYIMYYLSLYIYIYMESGGRENSNDDKNRANNSLELSKLAVAQANHFVKLVCVLTQLSVSLTLLSISNCS